MWLYRKHYMFNVHVWWSCTLRMFFQEGVKTENDHINLKVAGQDGSVVQFKIKRHTPLSKLMKAYCERQVRGATDIPHLHTSSGSASVCCLWMCRSLTFKLCVVLGFIYKANKIPVWWSANQWDWHTCTGLCLFGFLFYFLYFYLSDCWFITLAYSFLLCFVFWCDILIRSISERVKS